MRCEEAKHGDDAEERGRTALRERRDKRVHSRGLLGVREGSEARRELDHGAVVRGRDEGHGELREKRLEQRCDVEGVFEEGEVCAPLVQRLSRLREPPGISPSLEKLYTPDAARFEELAELVNDPRRLG